MIEVVNGTTIDACTVRVITVSLCVYAEMKMEPVDEAKSHALC